MEAISLPYHADVVLENSETRPPIPCMNVRGEGERGKEEIKKRDRIERIGSTNTERSFRARTSRNPWFTALARGPRLLFPEALSRRSDANLRACKRGYVCINAGMYNISVYPCTRARTYTYAHVGCLFLEDTRVPCHSQGMYLHMARCIHGVFKRICLFLYIRRI